jgi:hypothetical protein
MPRGIYVDATVTLVTEECCACGVTFGMPSDLRRQLLDNHSRSFYCPNGDRQHYTGKTDAEKLRDSQGRETHLKDQLEAAVRETEATRVALLRDRQRFANGVCPCCNRFFPNVNRHMTSQHPDYDVTKVKASRPSRRGFKCTCGSAFDTLHGLRVHQGMSRRDDWATAAGQKSWHSGHLTVV